MTQLWPVRLRAGFLDSQPVQSRELHTYEGSTCGLMLLLMLP